MKLYINSLFVGLVSFVWASIYWLGDANMWQVEKLTSLDLPKPWVYRQLVPELARLLSLTGLRIDYALALVVTLSGVAFYLSLRKLYFYYYPESSKGEIYVVGSVFVGMLVFGYNRLPYDLTTAFLMMLGLYYILTVQNWKYLIVFVFACLNRETSFLLILVYVVVLYYRKYGSYWWVTACQIYIYGLITYCLRLIFQYNPGSSLWVEPWQNLVRYANHPLQTIIYAMVLAVVLLRVFRNWNSKFYSLRLAFVVIAPILFVMFMVCGQAFEVRVFWEVYPLVVLLI